MQMPDPTSFDAFRLISGRIVSWMASDARHAPSWLALCAAWAAFGDPRPVHALPVPGLAIVSTIKAAAAASMVLAFADMTSRGWLVTWSAHWLAFGLCGCIAARLFASACFLMVLAVFRAALETVLAVSGFLGMRRGAEDLVLAWADRLNRPYRRGEASPSRPQASGSFRSAG